MLPHDIMLKGGNLQNLSIVGLNMIICAELQKSEKVILNISVGIYWPDKKKMQREILRQKGDLRSYATA